jgi:hypothetical protein
MALGTQNFFEPFLFFLCCSFSKYENHDKSSGPDLELSTIKNPEENSSGSGIHVSPGEDSCSTQGLFFRKLISRVSAPEKEKKESRKGQKSTSVRSARTRKERASIEKQIVIH